MVADVRALPFAAAQLRRGHRLAVPPPLRRRARSPRVLRALFALARRALVVNDLRRARVPYVFGRAAFPLLFRSRVSVEDGLLSIRRAFTRRASCAAAFAAGGHPGVRIAAHLALPAAGGRGEARRAMSGARARRGRGGRRPGGRGDRHPPAPARATTCCCWTRRASRATRSAARASRPRPGGCWTRMGAAAAVRALRPQPAARHGAHSPDGTAFRGDYRGAAARRLRRAPRRTSTHVLLGLRARGRASRCGRDARVTRLHPGATARGRGVVSRERRRARRAVRARLVVGADGRRSVVARRLGLLREHRRLRKFAVRGYWDGDGGPGGARRDARGRRRLLRHRAARPPPRANVTFVLDRRGDGAPPGGDLEGFYRRDARARWPRVAERLARARAAWSRPRAIGPLALEAPPRVRARARCWWATRPASTIPSPARA